MKRLVAFGMVSLVIVGLAVSLGGLGARQQAVAQEQAMTSVAGGSGTMLAHMVYFSLNDPTDENKRTVLEACQKYLTGHPGTVFFAAGTCADYKRDVNDRDFDIALQLVFKDRAAHDAYQASPRHQEFIAACRGLWKKVRVFDSDVTGAKN